MWQSEKLVDLGLHLLRRCWFHQVFIGPGGKALFEEMGGKSITVSLTHSRDIAFAVVIFEGKQDGER